MRTLPRRANGWCECTTEVSEAVRPQKELTTQEINEIDVIEAHPKRLKNVIYRFRRGTRASRY